MDEQYKKIGKYYVKFPEETYVMYRFDIKDEMIDLDDLACIPIEDSISVDINFYILYGSRTYSGIEFFDDRFRLHATGIEDTIKTDNIFMTFVFKDEYDGVNRYELVISDSIELGIYQFCKEGFYEVTGVATVCDDRTNRLMVEYHALYGDKRKWVRDLDEFLSEVDHIKYPDIDSIWKYELIQFDRYKGIL